MSSLNTIRALATAGLALVLMTGMFFSVAHADDSRQPDCEQTCKLRGDSKR